MQKQEPEIMYLLQDVTLKHKGKVCFQVIKGDYVEITYNSSNIMTAINREGQKGYVMAENLSADKPEPLNPELLSYTPAPNPPGQKPERVETQVTKPLDRPPYIPSKLTSPTPRQGSKVKHVTNASTLF